MKNAGCYSVQLGVESGNDDILKGIKKGTTVKEITEAARLIKKHGLQLHAFFMFGFPDDTEKTMRDTLNVLKEMDTDSIIYSVFTPYPGTIIFEQLKERGMVDNSFDVSKFNHQSPENCFSANIEKKRFREILSEVEKSVDDLNRKKKLNLGLAMITRRIRERGLIKSAQRFFQILKS